MTAHRSPVRTGRENTSAMALEDRRRLASELAKLLRFERLLSDLSSLFIHLPPSRIDSEIERGLRRLVEFLGVDRGIFWEFDEETKALRATHSWSVAGVEPMRGVLASDLVPWATDRFLKDRIFTFAHRGDLPDEAVAERRFFEQQGTKSHLTIPLEIGGALIGGLSFGAMRTARDWPRELVDRLRLVGEVFAHALERRRAEELRQRHQAELAHVARVATLGELAAAIAHELNQPLAAILANAQAAKRFLEPAAPMLLGLGVDESLQEILDDVAGDARRAQEVIRRLRDLLRKGDVRKHPLDVNDMIRDVETFARADALENDVDLAFDLTPGLPPAEGDRVQLQQVVLNLVRNGSEAMRDAGDSSPLLVRTGRDGKAVLVAVSDAGPPLDDAVFARMFDPFFTTKPAGLGMGLAISRSIVEAHGGRLWATRNAGRGLTVRLALPPAEEGAA